MQQARGRFRELVDVPQVLARAVVVVFHVAGQLARGFVGHALLQPELIQDAVGIRGDIHAGPDLAELGCLLVQLHVLQAGV